MSLRCDGACSGAPASCIAEAVGTDEGAPAAAPSASDARERKARRAESNVLTDAFNRIGPESSKSCGSGEDLLSKQVVRVVLEAPRPSTVPSGLWVRGRRRAVAETTVFGLPSGFALSLVISMIRTVSVLLPEIVVQTSRYGSCM
ncbi:hypothetical protein ERJ75_000852600 [Trypanosoma vivax]|nr:hypothetical protein ERJ75_000852600 [Trypanosoma vivax]